MNSLIHFFRGSKILLLILAVLFSCKTTEPTTATINTPPANLVNQGIGGTVLYKEGSFFPDGRIKGNARVYGVSRTLYFYELTNMKSVELAEGDFLTNIFSDMIDSTHSDEQGNFIIALSEGKYSVVIQENERLYSKLNDRAFYWPVEVKRDSVSKVILEIDYKAKY